MRLKGWRREEIIEKIGNIYGDAYAEYCRTAQPGCVPFRDQLAVKVLDAIEPIMRKAAFDEVARLVEQVLWEHPKMPAAAKAAYTGTLRALGREPG